MNLRVLTVSCLLTLCLGGIGLESCVKSNTGNNNTPTSTIMDIVNNSTNLTILKSALVRTNLDAMLSQPGPYTLIAPTDASFANAGLDTAAIAKLTDAQLKSILLYHILSGTYPSSALPVGPNGSLTTSSGDSIFVTNTGDFIYVNGNALAVTDVVASNGIMHSIVKTLIPATGNIVQELGADTVFSYLSAAISRADQGTQEVIAALSGPIVTVFAPTNAAFRSAGFATINDINNANPDSLANIVLYNALHGRLFSSDLANGGTVRAINDSILVVNAGSPVTVKGTKNATSANVIGYDFVAHNGVIEATDQVLLP